MLTKKLADAAEIREKLEEQLNDVRKQLRTVRDENKVLNARVQTLETDMRRGNQKGKNGAEQSARENATENLLAERDALKKEVETAERLAKQAQEATKTKDTQLKRALETIARLKSQLEEAQAHAQVRPFSHLESWSR